MIRTHLVQEQTLKGNNQRSRVERKKRKMKTETKHLLKSVFLGDPHVQIDGFPPPVFWPHHPDRVSCVLCSPPTPHPLTSPSQWPSDVTHSYSVFPSILAPGDLIKGSRQTYNVYPQEIFPCKETRLGFLSCIPASQCYNHLSSQAAAGQTWVAGS